MLKPILLPLQITAIVLFLLAAAVYVYLNRRSKNQTTAIVLAGIFGLVAFVPALIGIGFVVDMVRYGTFTYESARQIQDPSVQLPAQAQDIELHKSASGHEVMFSVSHSELQTWMSDLTKQRRSYTDATPFVRDETLNAPATAIGFWEMEFGQRGWECPKDVIRYQGWHSGRGAGFDVWYSPVAERAFIRASYW